MDQLFEATFSTLAATQGKALSKCGKCRRYMKYIALRPPRLHCATCDEIYALPPNGTVKQYKGLVCPIDGFELVLFSLGSDATAYPLCPYCYQNPPFEGIKTGMGCNACPHPTCTFALPQQGVCPCQECESGTLVLDSSAPPRWKLCCNRCNAIVKLPQAKSTFPVWQAESPAWMITLGRDCGRVDVTTTRELCEVCGATELCLQFPKELNPLAPGESEYRGCVLCDEKLNALAELKYVVSSVKLVPARCDR